MPVIGFLHSGTAAPFAAQVNAFQQGLKEGSYVVGQNVAIEYRWAEGKFDRLPELAADLVRRKVNVIAAVGGPPSVRCCSAPTPSTAAASSSLCHSPRVTRCRPCTTGTSLPRPAVWRAMEPA
jgi:hypothetical protein